MWAAFEAPFSTVAGNALKKYWNNNFVAESVMADWLAFWKIWIVGGGYCVGRTTGATM